MDTEIPCVLCGVVDEYVRLANEFTQGLSDVLLGPFWAIFLGISGLWIISHGMRVVTGKPDVAGFFHELVFLIIAAALLGGQGPWLVNMIYKAALSTMSGAASLVLEAGGGITAKTNLNGQTIDYVSQYGQSTNGINGLDGMTGLVAVAQKGVFKVFGLAQSLGRQTTLTNLWPVVFALLILAPYAILMIVYFAQVVVTIFRVMMFAAVSPILMMALGFGWGKDTAINGARTLFAAFMVLFGSTIALAVCLYGVTKLGIGDAVENQQALQELLSLDNPKLWVAIALGWLGTAFMAEATGMANSIAGSKLTNQAAAVITAGAVASGAYFVNRTRGQWGGAAGGAANLAGNVAGTGAYWAGAGTAKVAPAALHVGASKVSAGAQAVLDKIRPKG
ncbi:MAG: hypothetical protein CMM61_09640 [Rhodospirillaceae bacterium]|nr:hypothetical protein [Rhodospirillaceae bacterium]